MYIHAQSNHPKSIINQLPKSIESRLNKLSSNKNIFIEASKHYQTALNTCGYDYKLQHKVHENKQTNKNKRKRNIIWFNPPYSKNNIHHGKELLDHGYEKKNQEQKSKKREGYW